MVYVSICGGFVKLESIEELKKFFAVNPFVISDTRFFHDRVFNELQQVRQQFATSREEFDQKMVKVLRKHSPLLHLGDVSINSKDSEKFHGRIKKVNHWLDGIPKVLVMENHDRGGEDLYSAGGWLVVNCGVDLVNNCFYPQTPPFIFHEAGGQRILFSHEPVLVNWEENNRDNHIVRELTTWFQHFGATRNVHGHVHSYSLKDPVFRNVSVEAMDFCPQRLSHVISRERNDLTGQREER
jgi:calcineurin-like phosphoesterase family protein